jgi:hypothetical protein
MDLEIRQATRRRAGQAAGVIMVRHLVLAVEQVEDADTQLPMRRQAARRAGFVLATSGL